MRGGRNVSVLVENETMVINFLDELVGVGFANFSKNWQVHASDHPYPQGLCDPAIATY